MAEITKETFHSEVKVHHTRNPNGWMMIRPDRHFDQTAHRYPDDEARRKGNTAMRAWFEYLAVRGFYRTFNAWRAILKSGRSIMVPCADPLAFDLKFGPPGHPALPPDFWTELLPLDRRHESLEDRERCLAAIKGCAESLRMNAARRAPAAAPPVRPLREWKPVPLAKIDPSNPPPKLSDEVRAKLAARNIPVAE